MTRWPKKFTKEGVAILAATAWALIAYALLGGIRFSPEDQVLSFAPLSIAVLYSLVIRLKKNTKKTSE